MKKTLITQEMAPIIINTPHFKTKLYLTIELLLALALDTIDTNKEMYLIV